jgi:hypothetical protein
VCTTLTLKLVAACSQEGALLLLLLLLLLLPTCRLLSLLCLQECRLPGSEAQQPTAGRRGAAASWRAEDDTY